MNANIVIVPPVLYVPAYGGTFKNGQIIGYGSIRDNINKKICTGYFSDSLLSPSPIMSTYIEWTTAPEKIMMVLGNFSEGKVHGVVYKYLSTGSVYCKNGENKSNIIARVRYARATKVKQSCTNGIVDSSEDLGSTTLMMNWVNNNLLNVFDIGDQSIDVGYEVDNAIRPNSIKLVPINKPELSNSIYA